LQERATTLGTSNRHQLETSGFTLAQLAPTEHAIVTTLPLFKMDQDPSVKQQYYTALETMVSRVTGAAYVRASNAVLRRSSIVGVHTRPIGDDAPRGPVNDVHCDFAPGAPAIGLMQQKQELLGELLGFSHACSLSRVRCAP
jgi:hypothetical protein